MIIESIHSEVQPRARFFVMMWVLMGIEKFGNNSNEKPEYNRESESDFRDEEIIDGRPVFRKKTPESELEDFANDLDDNQRNDLRNILRKIGINLTPK